MTLETKIWGLGAWNGFCLCSFLCLHWYLCAMDIRPVRCSYRMPPLRDLLGQEHVCSLINGCWATVLEKQIVYFGFVQPSSKTPCLICSPYCDRSPFYGTSPSSSHSLSSTRTYLPCNKTSSTPFGSRIWKIPEFMEFLTLTWSPGTLEIEKTLDTIQPDPPSPVV